MIRIKTKDELEMIRQSGRILAKVMRQLERCVKPGVTTQELAERAEELIAEAAALPAFKGYKGYPAAVCTSVNEQVVHGIPGGYILREGDIISLDVGVDYKGYFSDCAVTVPVGKIDARKKQLIDAAKKALAKGISQAISGNHLSDISHAIQAHVEAQGFSVVRQFVGHGVGLAIHEEPEIPNFGRAHMGPILKPGMVLAIEPMVNIGTWEVMILEDGWTVVTKDGLASSHFEHTVAVTEHGPEILTKMAG